MFSERDFSMSNAGGVEVTLFTKSGGPLTKRISLGADGKVTSDGSACTMSKGTARRVKIADVGQFGRLVEAMTRNEAIALGTLRPGLPNQVKVVTKDKNNGSAVDVIARTADSIVFRPNEPALALLDHDTKGMPPHVERRLSELGGFWPALVSVLPTLDTTARVTRASTSAGLSRAGTNERLPGSNGLHVYLWVKDGTDIERFLKTLHGRCWLNGLGWMMVGAGGQLLERSVVDRMVGAAERLVFEGAPVLEPPLEQDQEKRRPVVTNGVALDTVAACPPLMVVENAKLEKLQAEAKQQLAHERAKARAGFIAREGKRLAERIGISARAAARVLAQQCDGVLLPDVVLQFDDREFRGASVGDILADPARFEGATLADPLEGVPYGRCKAKVMRRADGTPWIHSFAHGRTIYELKHDARAVRAAMERADDGEVVGTLVDLALDAELESDEWEELRDHAAKLGGVNKRTVDAQLKRARGKQLRRRAEEENTRQLAERLDPRPRLARPSPDAPWLPQMEVLNEVLSAARPTPMRNVEGFITQVRERRVPGTHAFTQQDANQEGEATTELSAPEQHLLTPLDEVQCSELIERHVDYVDRGRSVHLAPSFVRHYLRRADGALPTVAAVAFLPIVLADGDLLSSNGLDRERGIFFVVPEELLARMRRREECTPEAVAEAMRFLCDDWLCDVATDYVGKCVLVAAALTMIERSLLPDRPTFFVTAGRRGGGKTTALAMLVMAAAGTWPAAAAWSPNEEERRKALLSYFMEGVPYILWDNIPRGTQVSCPHIEKSCTSAHYSDRRLGVSEAVTTAASTIHLFTGNNIGPGGDLASRSLQVRLEVDRADPENRDFRHPDPVAWTQEHRAEILRALYTVLLGNPTLDASKDAAMRTRFKLWWRLVGSAVEQAAERAAGHAVDFRALFLEQEADDEESASLAEALDAIAGHNQGTFKAADVVAMMANAPEGGNLRATLFPEAAPGFEPTAKAVGRRLKRHVGEVVKRGDHTLVLRERKDGRGGPKGARVYSVDVLPQEGASATAEQEPNAEPRPPAKLTTHEEFLRMKEKSLEGRGWSSPVPSEDSRLRRMV